MAIIPSTKPIHTLISLRFFKLTSILFSHSIIKNIASPCFYLSICNSHVSLNNIVSNDPSCIKLCFFTCD